MSGRNRDDPAPRVQYVSRAYFEAEFGPLDQVEHVAEIGPSVERTPAFMVWPQLLDDAPPPLKLRPVDPPPEAA